jgi:hypothetical protein
MKTILTLAAALAGLAVTQVQAQPGPQARGAQPPGGDYWRSCRDVSTYDYGDNAVLVAQCRDERGRWRGASLRYGRCREIENRDGDLVCRDGGGQPPWSGGGGWTPGDGGWRGGSVTLYTGPDFSGQPYEARDEVTNLPRNVNDRAISLRIEGRGAWEVCADSDFRGRCQVFDRDVRDLRQYGLGEAISSMRPVR